MSKIEKKRKTQIKIVEYIPFNLSIKSSKFVAVISEFKTTFFFLSYLFVNF